MDWGNKRALSVAGGKGGIGKSSFTANLGVVLAQMGKRVVLVDADIGAANLHTMVGITYPKKTLADFFKNPRADLENSIVDTPYRNLRLLSSASDILAIAAPDYKMNQRLYRSLQKLRTDVIIFDIAAGTNYRAIDFFSLAPDGIVIVEPVPTSLENAFLFVKNLLYRFLLRMFYADPAMKALIKQLSDPASGTVVHFNSLLDQLASKAPEKIERFRSHFEPGNYAMHVVANSMRTTSQTAVVGNFTKIVKRYLGLNLAMTGYLPHEDAMDAAITARTPLVVRNPDCGYALNLRKIAQNLAF